MLAAAAAVALVPASEQQELTFADAYDDGAELEKWHRHSDTSRHVNDLALSKKVNPAAAAEEAAAEAAVLEKWRHHADSTRHGFDANLKMSNKVYSDVLKTTCDPYCRDVLPPSNWEFQSCAEQLKDTSKCDMRRMGNLTDGFCHATCGVCIPCEGNDKQQAIFVPGADSQLSEKKCVDAEGNPAWCSEDGAAPMVASDSDKIAPSPSPEEPASSPAAKTPLKQSDVQNCAACSKQYGLVDPEAKIVMGWTARAACTLAVGIFIDHLGQLKEAWDYDPSIHGYRMYKLDKKYVATLEDVQNKEMTSFKIVRNPFARAVSSYSHQMMTDFSHSNCHDDNCFGAELRYVLGLSASAPLTGVSFIAWLRAMRQVRDKYATLGRFDEHTMLQTSEGEFQGKITYGTICRLEDDLRACLRHVNMGLNVERNFSLHRAEVVTSSHNAEHEETTGDVAGRPWGSFKPSTIDLRVGHTATGNHSSLGKLDYRVLPTVRDFYQGGPMGAEAMRIVAELYSKDFIWYGYDKESTDGILSVSSVTQPPTIPKTTAQRSVPPAAHSPPAKTATSAVKPPPAKATTPAVKPPPAKATTPAAQHPPAKTATPAVKPPPAKTASVGQSPPPKSEAAAETKPDEKKTVGPRWEPGKSSSSTASKVEEMKRKAAIATEAKKKEAEIAAKAQAEKDKEREIKAKAAAIQAKRKAIEEKKKKEEEEHKKKREEVSKVLAEKNKILEKNRVLAEKDKILEWRAKEAQKGRYPK